MKSIFKSKTAALAVITALAGFWRESREFMQENTQLALTVLAAIQVGIRLITQGKLTLFAEAEVPVEPERSPLDDYSDDSKPS